MAYRVASAARIATSAECSSSGTRVTTVAAAVITAARSDLLDRRPQCGHVQVRAVLLNQLQFLEQHLRRPRERA
ncbi:hypothetical protein SAMN06272775_7047 [Streptomyces sp. 2323.1]|uniref:hypothetical protein n=1 Tax=Streptomyces sp. 2323.1 TaxID=1938841 RepID=UPI000BB7A2BC|nr:hypothetical protein [Streptomyces sp. 2323.1]SOE16152.1 hypothetical protein SAMN06272775_7047 [Streptomyces sp. 2323.1]